MISSNWKGDGLLALAAILVLCGCNHTSFQSFDLTGTWTGVSIDDNGTMIVVNASPKMVFSVGAIKIGNDVVGDYIMNTEQGKSYLLVSGGRGVSSWVQDGDFQIVVIEKDVKGPNLIDLELVGRSYSIRLARVDSES